LRKRSQGVAATFSAISRCRQPYAKTVKSYQDGVLAARIGIESAKLLQCVSYDFDSRSVIHGAGDNANENDTVEVNKHMAIPNLWRTKKQRYSLQADVCVHCDKIMFPPREVCPHCHKAARQKATAAPFVALMPVVNFAQPLVAAGDD
jgi:hypothetical protein